MGGVPFENPRFTFVLNRRISEAAVKTLANYLDCHGVADYQILDAIQLEVTDHNVKDQSWHLYADYHWDFKKYVPPFSVVVPFGEALFSIVENNDLDGRLVQDENSDDTSNKAKARTAPTIVTGFYDTLLWKTHFFDPASKCYIFPVDSIDLLTKDVKGKFAFKDNFERYFFDRQVFEILKFNPERIRIGQPKKVVVTDFKKFVEEHSAKCLTAFDTETELLDPFSKAGFLLCMSCSFDGRTGYTIPWNIVDVPLLVEWLKDRPLLGANIKYDLKWTSVKGGVPLETFKVVGDTMLLQQTLNELQRKGLKPASYLYTYFGGYEKPLDTYIDEHPECKGHYAKIPPEILYPYAAMDACVTFLIHKAQVEYMRRLDALVNSGNPYGYSLEVVYNTIKIPAIMPYTEAEIHGMGVNAVEMEKLGSELKVEIKEITSKVCQQLEVDEKEFNLGSNDDLGKKIRDLGWSVRDLTQKQIPKVGEEQLLRWKKLGYTAAADILKYRELSKLFSTYVGDPVENTGMYKMIHDDLRLHPLYHLFAAQSQRGTSSNPNGQNFTSHGEKANRVRKYITPPEGEDYCFISGDYSGLQLRKELGSCQSRLRIAFLTKQCFVISRFKVPSH